MGTSERNGAAIGGTRMAPLRVCRVSMPTLGRVWAGVLSALRAVAFPHIGSKHLVEERTCGFCVTCAVAGHGGKIGGC